MVIWECNLKVLVILPLNSRCEELCFSLRLTTARTVIPSCRLHVSFKSDRMSTACFCFWVTVVQYFPQYAPLGSHVTHYFCFVNETKTMLPVNYRDFGIEIPTPAASTLVPTSYWSNNIGMQIIRLPDHNPSCAENETNEREGVGGRDWPVCVSGQVLCTQVLWTDTKKNKDKLMLHPDPHDAFTCFCWVYLF